MRSLSICFFVLLTLLSCKKEEGKRYPTEPIITLVSIKPTVVTNFDNQVFVTITYKDNNGDLGFTDPDEFSLEVKDSRLDSADYYHIPPLAPLDENIVIEGQLTIALNSLFILGNGSSEVAALSIKLKDRAGHWSNSIITPNITIQR